MDGRLMLAVIKFYRQSWLIIRNWGTAQVDVSGVDAAKFDDAYFKPTEKKDKKKGEKEFFEVRFTTRACVLSQQRQC